MNYNKLRILYTTEQHLTLALKTLKEESHDETRRIIYTALSSVGQLQEILEQEALNDFEEQR
jgi:hypothetical protein|tara:strand:+ start:221 stop:406 length:186 start_codon:yes stop_codon:yes gene_type:complete